MKWHKLTKENVPNHERVVLSDCKTVWRNIHKIFPYDFDCPVYFMYIEDIPLPGSDFSNPRNYFDDPVLDYAKWITAKDITEIHLKQLNAAIKEKYGLGLLKEDGNGDGEQ